MGSTHLDQQDLLHTDIWRLYICPVDVKRFQHMFLKKTMKTEGYVNNLLMIQISSCHFCQVK